MRRFSILSSGCFLFLSLLVGGPQSLTYSSTHLFDSCLPKGIKPTDIVSSQLVGSTQTLKKTTVEQKLIELKASCEKGKLVDAAGREIRFYRLEGCWGNPPADYQEILQKQSEELEKLRKQYTVIEMTCNSDGVQIQ
jgi:hypothetical protein